MAPNKQDKFFLIFTNRYLVHILVILIGLGVATSNLLAYESKEDYGQNALMYKLAGVSDVEIIEDTNNSVDNTKVYNYQDQGDFLSGNSFAQDNSDQDNALTDQATTQGDLALLKPEVIGVTGSVSSSNQPSTAASVAEYAVVQGDSIGSIARKFGVSVETILWANGLSFSSYVKPGQKLLVPSVSGVLYKVAKGDTLLKIAQHYSVSDASLRQANDLSGDNLVVGQMIIIPGGRVIATPKPLTPVIAKKPPKISTAGVANETTVEVSGTGKMSWPNGCHTISQYFKGWRHTGVDIACPWGTPLRAADTGRVSRVQYGTTGYGYNVIIDHGDGVQTLYGHMSEIDVNVGDEVDKGQVIGREGSTGNSTGPHVHFEVRINGVKVNPLTYIR